MSLKIGDKIDALCQDSAVMKAQIQSIVDDIGEMKNKLFGNGHDGLCTRVDRLEQRQLINIQRSDLTWRRIATISVAIGTTFAVVSFFLNKIWR